MACFQSATLIVLLISMAALVHGTDNYTCEVRCGQNDQGTFCGSDNTCHELSCEHYYKYGMPRSHSGWTSAAPSLSCKDIPITIPDISKVDGYKVPASVAYRCKSRFISPIEMGFNRLCNVFDPDSGAEFICFELKTSTNFQPFLDKVEASGLNCTDSSYNETGYPQFKYGFSTALRTSEKEGTRIITKTIELGNKVYNNTSEFNKAFALDGTMFSVRIEKLKEQKLEEPKLEEPTSSAFSNKIKNISNIFTLLGAIVMVSLVCEV